MAGGEPVDAVVPLQAESLSDGDVSNGWEIIMSGTSTAAASSALIA